MIKYFCDICGKETSDEGRLNKVITITKDKVVSVEIMVGLNGSWNHGNFHHKCVAQLIGSIFKK